MLNRLSQIGRKVEAVEGSEEALVAADYRGNFKEQDFTSDITRYQRELQRAALTKLQDIAGHRIGKVSFLEELVGGGAATAAPWHTDIRGMGWVPTGLKVVALGVVTNGPFLCGQRIGNNATEGSATVTGIAVIQLSGPTRLVYMPVTGAFTDAMQVFNYGAASQASADVDSAPADAGFALRPFSESDAALPPSLTIEQRVGGYRYSLVGARGTGGLTLRMSEPWLLRAEFQGPPVYDAGNPGRPRTGAYVAGVLPFAAAPKVTKGIPLVLRDGSTSYTPILTELTTDFGNTLANRATIANNDIGDSGYLATRITDRRITMSIDPEKVLAGTFDYDAIVNVGRPFSVTAQLGLQTDANGMLILHAPAVAPSGSLGFGDRDGIRTQPIELMATGDADDELQIYHVFGA